MVIDGATLRRFWEQMKDALHCFHGRGYAHMDVKPANILITANGDFLLADLGSLTTFGNRSESTKAYVPVDLWDGRALIASASVDWWTAGHDLG